MLGKRFSFLVLLVPVAALISLPASASATGTHFSISGPESGDVINAIPSTPGLSFSSGYAFQSTPTCTWDSLTPGPCDGAYGKPTTDGSHTLTLAGTIVTDGGATVVGPDSDSVTIEYDTTIPSLTIDSPAYGAELPSTQPSFAFTASDDANGFLNKTCKIDSGSAAPCTSPFTPGAPLSQGGHNLQVVANDGVNTTTVNHTFIVDTVAPVVSVIFPTPNAVVDSSVPEVNLSIEGATAGSFCKFDDQAYQSCGASWLGGSLADGAHTLYVRGVDIAGNETVVVVPFVVDDVLGSTPVPYETSITGGKGGKVKRGKFVVKAGFSLLGPEGSSASVLCAAKVKATLKPKGGRTYTDRIQMMNKNGRCVASTTFTLPKRFKGKRAKLTFRYPGTAALGALSRSKTIKKL